MPPLLPTSSHFTRCCQTWKAIIERLAKFGLEMTGSNPNNRTKMNCVGQTWSNMGFPWKHKVGPSHFLNHPVVFVAYPVYIQCLWPNPEFEIIWVLSFRSVVESLPTPWLPSIVLKFFELISIGGSPWLSLVSHGFTTLEAIHGVGSVIWKWRHPHANWSPAISLSLSFPFRCFPGSRYWRLDLLQTQCLHGSLMFSGCWCWRDHSLSLSHMVAGSLTANSNLPNPRESSRMAWPKVCNRTQTGNLQQNSNRPAQEIQER